MLKKKYLGGSLWDAILEVLEQAWFAVNRAGFN